VREVKEAYERIAEVFRESRGKPWTWVFDRLPNRDCMTQYWMPDAAMGQTPATPFQH